MTYEEVKATCLDLKKQGYKDQDILRAFGRLFIDGTIDTKQLMQLLTIINLKLKDDFLALSIEEQRKFIKKNWNL